MIEQIIEDNDDDYNPYCKNCSSCGEDGCCSYLSCIRHAVANNTGCNYPNTYLEEVFLRDAFLRLCFENMNKSKEITDFIQDMYDKAYEDLVNYAK
jgi:hypothetical protein